LRSSEKAFGLVRIIMSRSRSWMFQTLLHLDLLHPHGMPKMEAAFLRIMRG
jgi:hypothetical protein